MIQFDLHIEVLTTHANSDFKLVPIRELGTSGWGRADRYHHFVKAAHQLMIRENWDIIHAITPCLRCHVYQPRSGFSGPALARSVAARKNPVARWFRQMGGVLNRKQQLLARLERQLLCSQHPPLVATLSRYMRQQLEQEFSFPPALIREVFNGVTIALPNSEDQAKLRRKYRLEWGFSEKDLLALFAGHNFRRKGLAQALHALARPEASGWRLLVAGKDHPQSYQRLSQQLGLANRVLFLGPRSDIRQIYFAADANILPSYYDPCARTVLEGLSVGLPTITTKDDGAADCIRPGENGFVLESAERVDTLAECLGALRDEKTRSRMARTALQSRPFLSMKRHARQMYEVYQEVSKLLGGSSSATRIGKAAI